MVRQSISDNQGDHSKSEEPPKKKHARCPNKYRRFWQRNKVSLFISVISLFGAAILFAIAIAVWQQGHLWPAFYWGLISYVILGFAIFFSYHAYVIEPSERPRPIMPPDRPWLSVAVIPAGDIVFAADGSATFTFKFSANNSGRMPASNARLSAEVIFPKVGGDQLLMGANRRLQEISKQTDAQRSDIWDFGTIFPGKDSVESVSVGLQIDAATMTAQFAETPPGIRDCVSPSLVGCVTYTFEANGHEFTGQSGFVYEIYRTIPNKPGGSALRIGENVPVNEIVISKPEIIKDFAK